MPVSRIWTTLAIAAVAWAATAVAAQQARASAPHTVLPGETLWSIAASYNFTTRTVAAFNGVSEDASVYAGETIQIPTESEGAAALASAGITAGSSSSSSGATAPHLVTPGESLWSIAAANGLSVETLAATNGLSSDSLLLIGQTIQVPASSGSGSAAETGAGPPPPEPPYWVSSIYCPCGEVYLASNAAANWEAMRQESLSVYGIDLYPDGTLSGVPLLRASSSTSTTSTSRGRAASPRSRAPPCTSTGPRSTSPSPPCAPSSTRSAPTTAGPRSRPPTSGGTSTTSARRGLRAPQPTPAGTSSSRTSTRGKSRSTSLASRLPAPKCWVDSAPQATP